MSFTDGKPRIATEECEHLNNGRKPEIFISRIDLERVRASLQWALDRVTIHPDVDKAVFEANRMLAVEALYLILDKKLNE